MAHQNSIELNGKRYDAVTGRLIGTVPKPATAQKPVASKPHTGGRAIDGVVRSSAHGPLASATKPLRATAHPTSAPAPRKAVSMRATKTLAAHQPQKSQTLIRRSVHKPDVAMKPKIKTQHPAEVIAAPLSAIAPKLSVQKIDPHRLDRAAHTPKSARVKRFDMRIPAAQRNFHLNNPAHVASRPTPAAHPASRPPAKPRATHDPFESAIAHAESHKQPPVEPPRRRSLLWLRSTAIAMLAVGLIATVAYLNLHNIELRLVSARAGFHAVLPTYTPTGYEMNAPVQANGKVTLSFHSGSSSFILTEQQSSWDSQTLLASTVGLATGPYQTVQSNGRTVYLYGNNATWVNGGILFSLATDGNLSSSQITNLATSM